VARGTSMTATQIQPTTEFLANAMIPIDRGGGGYPLKKANLYFGTAFNHRKVCRDRKYFWHICTGLSRSIGVTLSVVERGRPQPQLRRSHGVRETSEKVGFADALGGAAVHRCDNRLVSHPASAAEVTKIAREQLFPQPRQGRASKC